MTARATAFVTVFAQRLLLFGLLWWTLTAGYKDAAVFGAPVVIIAALVSTLTRIRSRASGTTLRAARLPALIRLIGFFLWNSLRGGIDVAVRAFRHPMPLKPDLIDYPLRLPPGPTPVLMASMVSLMPGTLAVIAEGRLRVHVLDRDSHWHRDLERLEQHIGDAYRIPGFRRKSKRKKPDPV